MSSSHDFRSRHPDINLPKDVSLWSWIFEAPHSSLSRAGQNTIQGWTDVSTGQHLSYQDVKNLTSRLSTALVQQRNLQQGDAIVVFARNTVWYPVVMLGAVRAGAIGCGCSPDYNVEELAYALTASKAKFVVTTSDKLNVAEPAASKAGIAPANILLLDEAATHTSRSIHHLIASVQGKPLTEPFKIPKNKTNAQICGYYGFSSGTTGLPKAVMISHANVMAQCLQIEQLTPTDHRRILAALPFYHITGVVHQLHLPVVLNAHVYILPTFTMEDMLATVERYKIKEILLVPPIIVRMVREDALLKKFDLRHVERFSSGAAPLSQEILSLLEKQFPGTGFKQGYGMTESCSCITAHPPDRYAYRYAARVGSVVASTEVLVVDPDTGRRCGVGEVGEIWARGPQITMGYLNNEKATRETYDADGFLHTGDIGCFDEEGMLSITDRLKEMVKVKGIGVAPAELEDLLLGHPAVDDCAVIGIADERAGERPKAFVVLAKGYAGREEDVGRELLSFVREKKTRHKWMKEVEFVSAIPKSPAGKILRKILRQKGRPVGVFVREQTPAAKL